MTAALEFLALHGEPNPVCVDCGGDEHDFNDNEGWTLAEYGPVCTSCSAAREALPEGDSGPLPAALGLALLGALPARKSEGGPKTRQLTVRSRKGG